MSIHVEGEIRVARRDHAYTLTLRDLWSKLHGFSIYSWPEGDASVWSWDEYKLALRPLYSIEYRGLISDGVAITLESGTKLFTSPEQLVLSANKKWVPACKLSGYVLRRNSPSRSVAADRVLSVQPCTAFDTVELCVMETRNVVVNGVILWA